MNERSERINSRTKAVAVVAIDRMVGSNRDINGPMKDLVDIFLRQPEAFDNDTVLQAQLRLGIVVRKLAQKVDGAKNLSCYECIQPEFWQTEVGQRVHRGLRDYFDKERAKVAKTGNF